MRKGWGYRADQMENTHPIYSNVEDVNAAESIFDGITYSKGAAVMRQLYQLIGRDNFKESMKRYFNKHQFSNATLDDLLSVMQQVVEENDKAVKGEHLDLRKFRKDWIETAGLNTVFCEWDTNKFREEGKLVLHQGWALESHKT